MAKKMESDDCRVLGPMLFLLLVMPPPLNAGSSWPRVLSWRHLNRHLGQEWEGFNQRARYHRSEKDKFRYCKGKFDLYFVVDRSDNMKNKREEIYSIVEKMVKKYTNPKLRMSFITSDGKTLMKPTSDRVGGKALLELEMVDNQAASLVISMIGGLMVEETVFETRKEAYKARNMGAKVYSVGLEDYSRRQLKHIVEGEHQIYEKSSYNTMDSFVNSVAPTPDIESHYNEESCGLRVLLSARTVSIRAIGYHLPSLFFRVVVVDYSLNNGVKFQDQTLKMTSRECAFNPPIHQTTSAENQQVSNLTTYQATCPCNTQASNPNICQATCPYNTQASDTTTNHTTCPKNPEASNPTSYQATCPYNTQTSNPTTYQATCPYNTQASNPTTYQATCPYNTHTSNPITYQATSPKSPQTSKPTTYQATCPYNTHTSNPNSSPPPPPPIKPINTHLYLVLLIPAMLMFPLLFCCIWPLRFKKTVKEPPPVQKPGKDKLDILCDFVQNYNQVPLMRCQPWNKVTELTLSSEGHSYRNVHCVCSSQLKDMSATAGDLLSLA
ncbi:anthrax toxin receptor-like [Myotis lucifugus]|uniref:anthrax toxin receptor-like n=1 Tax=Myotis lucifugus TaxID=59463 RepID=UPI0003C42290|nr:anthrax toxin receptor-like [Myotis lucifugus]